MQNQNQTQTGGGDEVDRWRVRGRKTHFHYSIWCPRVKQASGYEQITDRLIAYHELDPCPKCEHIHTGEIEIPRAQRQVSIPRETRKSIDAVVEAGYEPDIYTVVQQAVEEFANTVTPNPPDDLPRIGGGGEGTATTYITDEMAENLNTLIGVDLYVTPAAAIKAALVSYDGVDAYQQTEPSSDRQVATDGGNL
jgi:hypothetical protein